MTRLRIAESVIALLEEGDTIPTANDVANRAGVSTRLIFHHFEAMEDLFQAVMNVQFSRHWEPLRPVDASAELSERIEQTVRQRATLFDAISSVRRAGAAMATQSSAIAGGLAEGDSALRGWMEVTFAPELTAAGRGKRDLLDAIDASASWEMWDRLRRTQQLSAPAARRVIKRTLSDLLGA